MSEYNEVKRISYANFAWESTSGANSRTAKLTEQEVRWIRKSTKPAEELAAKYGVGVWTIKNVRSGRTYKSVK